MLALLATVPVRAFERDIHFGLTWWLAVQAGFERSYADAIALGDARVDGGMLETQALLPEYACFGRFADVALEVQQRHYPGARRVPAAPPERAVVAGDAAARSALAAVMRAAPGKEHLLLGRLGEALHPLQDSWAHAGVPTAPASIAGVACDATLASGHRPLRAFASPHAPELASADVAATLAMARATYDALLAWPPIHGKARRAAAWDALAPQVETYVRAPTKTAKRRWLAEQGSPTADFLHGISVPDGAEAGPAAWTLHKMPAFVHTASTQHEIAPETRTFFDRLLADWLGPGPLDAVGDAPAGREGRPPDAAARELEARLKLWKLADHGAVAELAHAPAPLSASQLKTVDRLVRAPGAVVVASPAAEALYPLLALGPAASPLLPYIVRVLPSDGAVQRAAALLRLRHAPYDTLVLIAERRGERWRLVDLQAAVEP